MWKSKEIDLGRVKFKEKATCIFEFYGNITVLKEGKQWKIKPSCGCTVSSWNPNLNQLTVSFTGKAVPVHLKEKGEFISTSLITVSAKEGTHVLKVKATNYE